MFAILLILVLSFIISLLHAIDQQRKKNAERQENWRKRAKLLRTGEEKGIVHKVDIFSFIISLFPHTYNFSIVCAL